MAAVDINRGTTGVSLPASVSNEIWGATVEDSTIMKVSRQIALPGNGVTIPMVTGEAVANWVAESDEKPVSRPTVSNKAMTAYKLAVIVPFSVEFRRDVGTLYNELVRRLPAALAKKFDSTVYGNSAAPGSNFDTLASVPTATVDATNTFTDLIGVVNTLGASGYDVSAWVAAPPLYGHLLTTTNALGQQIFTTGNAASSSVGDVLGSPVYKTRTAMPQGAGAAADTIGFAGDFAGNTVWGSVQGVQVSQSDQATLTDGGTTINLWQRNMFAVRAEIEVGFRLKDSAAILRLNDGTAD
jgi:HK97 family phage major capsid protein